MAGEDNQVYGYEKLWWLDYNSNNRYCFLKDRVRNPYLHEDSIAKEESSAYNSPGVGRTMIH